MPVGIDEMPDAEDRHGALESFGDLMSADRIQERELGSWITDEPGVLTNASRQSSNGYRRPLSM